MHGLLSFLAAGSLLFPAPFASALAQETVALHVPAAPLELVVVRPFEVAEPFEFRVAGEVVEYTKGHVLVVRVDKALVEPRNEADHVLFLGDSVLQKVNVGYEDGYIVAIAPDFDLFRKRLYFGARAVPARMTAADFTEQEEAAVQAGIQPFDTEVIAKARAQRFAAFPGRQPVGERFVAGNMNELWYQTAGLILQYAPAEEEMARSLLPR
jgi:hypothetical protein